MSPHPLISVHAALNLIKCHSPPSIVVKRAVNESIVGCVVAKDVVAAVSVPRFRASIVDGYAVFTILLLVVTCNGHEHMSIYSCIVSKYLAKFVWI